MTIKEKKTNRHFAFCVLLTLSLMLAIPGVSALSGGPDYYGYTFADSNTPGGPFYSWLDISGTGTQVLPNEDDENITVPIGFNFRFYGNLFDRIVISTNGITFPGNIGNTNYSNEPIGSSPGANNFIAPFWDDLTTQSVPPVTRIAYQVLGLPPNRLFVVEWKEIRHFGLPPNGVTFEAILHENSSRIRFQYQDTSFGNVNYDNGQSATVGIESLYGQGLQYSYNSPALSNNLAIQFDPPIEYITTTAQLSGTPGNDGWFKSNVTTTLSVFSTLGAVITQYQIGAGPWNNYLSPFIISDEGGILLNYNSTTSPVPTYKEPMKTAEVKIDRTLPTISVAPTTYPNPAGWYNTSVTLTFTCYDADPGPSGGSGLKSCQPNVVLATDGTGQSETGTAEDNAGNTNSASISFINIDKTPPTITHEVRSVSTGNNATPIGGWYNESVYIHYICSDALSGLTTASNSSCQINETIPDGANRPYSLTVSDKAGNVATDAGTINVNSLPSEIQITGVLNNTWYNTSVTPVINVFGPGTIVSQSITLNGTAFVSGTPVTIEGEYNLSVRVVNNVGHISQAIVLFGIDRVNPNITGAPTTSPNVNGWYNNNVIVHFTCTDDRSGIADCTSDQTLATENASAQNVTGYAKDNAGNTNSTNVSGILIDKSSPAIVGNPLTLPNANGWYDSPVVVRFTGIDLISGIDGPTSIDVTSSGEGSDVLVTAPMKDKANNSATGTYRLNIDLTAPVITISGVSNGVTYTTAVTPVVSIEASPSEINVSSVTLNGAPFISGTEITTNGTYTLAVSVTDNAGRSATSSTTFTTQIEPAATPTLVITANPSTVQAGTPTSVTFTVTGNGAPVNGATVTLTGAASATLTTLADGTAATSINAASAGLITATASKAGFNNGATAVNVEDTSSGEGTASGSGTILSPKNKKVTLKLSGVKNIGGVVKGKLKYTDSKAKITINGKITDLEINGNEAIISGVTTKGLDYTVTIVDNGSPGKGNDELTIEVPDKTYEASGVLVSGNLVVKEI